MKEIAIIGTTASGKTALALEIAKQTNCVILSLDSLSVYKQIDIASAKPTKEERGGIIHFGIDEVFPNEDFGVIEFLDCYKRAKEYAAKNLQDLLIVGGSSFYLKILLEGISLGVPTKQKLDISHEKAYEDLQKIDPLYMEKIKKNDKYRIEKAYNIYKQTKLSPSEYFLQNPKVPFVDSLQIFELISEVEPTREKIKQRTKKMFEDGLVDEVVFLDKTYGRSFNCMSSIGIAEVLEFLDGKISLQECENLINIHTAQLAKRQRTFNKSQFKNNQVTRSIKTNLISDVLKFF